MHIGILGGSFNPLHNDHIELLNYIYKKLSLDRFILIPNALPPHKTTCHVSFNDRVDMINKTVENLPYITVSMVEQDDSIPHYSFDTISELKQQFKNDSLYFCMGMDSFNYLDKWYRGLQIPDLCNLVITDRTGYDIEKSNSAVIEKLSDRIVKLEGQIDDLTDLEIIREIKNSEQPKIIYLKKEFTDISSSKIRTVFKDFYKKYSNSLQNFENFKEFDSNYYVMQNLPESITRYILENRLYAD